MNQTENELNPASTNEATEEQAVQNSEKSAKPTAKPKKRRCWRWLLCLVFLLILLLAAPLVFLATEKGQQTAISFAERFVDGLKIGKVQGSLQNGLSLKDSQFTMNGVEVAVGQADLHVDMQCALNLQACVKNIALKDTVVNIDTEKLPKSEAKESEPLGDILLPLKVSLDQMTLDNVQVNVDQLSMKLNHFKSGIVGEGRQFSLAPTELEGLTLTLPPSDTAVEVVVVEKSAMKVAQKVTKISKKEAEKGIDWTQIKEQLAKPILSKMDPVRLPVNVDVPQFKAKNIVLKQKDEKGKANELISIGIVDLVAHSNEEAVKLDKFEMASNRCTISGKGQMTLNGDYPLELNVFAHKLTMPNFDIPPMKISTKISGALFGTTKLSVQTQGGINANLNGSVRLTEPKTPLNVTLKTDQIAYPLVAKKGQEQLKLQKVDIALSGDLLTYRLDSAMNVKGMGIPDSMIDLKGKGSLTDFNLSSLTLNALGGKAELAGKVDWKNGVEWDSDVKLSNVNTKSLLPDWAAVLSGSLHSTGYAGRGKESADWAVSVDKMDLKGNLLQKNLQLQGALNASNKTLLDVKNAVLLYGENRIAMQGILGDKSDFTADIKAPNLKGLVPKLNAVINGKVRMYGKLTEPNVDLDLTANNVAYDNIKLQSLTAKGKVTTERVIQGDLKLTLKQFVMGDVKIASANVEAKGSESNHTLKLSADGKPVGASLQLAGSFDRKNEIWQGKLSNINIDSPVGAWKNDQTVSLAYNNKKVSANVSAHCWRNAKVNVCFPRAFNAGVEGTVPFEVRQFNLAVLQEYLGKDSQLSGLVNLKGDASWFKNRAPQVNAELSSNALKFVQVIDYRKLPITLTPVKITANLADNNLKLKTDVKLENNGRLRSDLVMRDITKARNLSGTINLDQITLKVLSPLLSKGENVNGTINANLNVGGSATSPLLNGNLNVSGLKAHIHSMPLDVTGGNLAMRFTGTHSTLTGSLQTTDSELKIDGDADWRKLDAWHSRVHAQANRFRVTIPNMARVEVSPNVEVRATPKEIILGGNIDIPWARIEVEELPASAVTVSSDEVIMDSPSSQRKKNSGGAVLNTVPQKTKSGMAIKADVKINIGDDVRLEAYGLKTGLKGLISVKQGKQGLGLYGQINLRRGTFASFGQDLVIQKGVITFAGLPSQPMLNIEAIRNPEAIEDTSVKAGVRVTGLADAPEVKLFSEPSMGQDEILSYILTGRSLENSGDAGSSNSVAAALLSMSLAKNSKLIGGIGSAFGLNDLSVTTAGIGDNTKVVASAGLTQNLRIKYGVGIFAALTELTLRYRLAPSLYLQWMSGLNQAVDLFYRFEFD